MVGLRPGFPGSSPIAYAATAGLSWTRLCRSESPVRVGTVALTDPNSVAIVTW